jgi:ABC-type multidrug transport system, ATPase and permease components
VFLPFIALVTYLVTSRSIPMYKEQQQAVDKLVRKVRENIVGIRVIKALSKGNYEKGQFQQVNTEVVKKKKSGNDHIYYKSFYELVA